MEINPNYVLEDCPVCRGSGMVVHEGGWNVQVECADCGSHTVYLDYENDKEKLKAYSEILYTQALLIEGMPIEDPLAYANLVCELMVGN